MKKYALINSFEEYKEYLKAFLLFFDTFCRKNDIKYTVFAGTMLGAIRNKDIIPWDGDVDVALTRSELVKLKEAFKKYEGRYHLSYPGNFYKRRSLREQHSFYCRIIDKKCPCPYFLIDVYTIDYLGDDYDKAVEGVNKIVKASNRLVLGPMFHLPAFDKEKGLVKNSVILLVHILYPLLFLISLILTPFLLKNIKNIEDDYMSFSDNSKYEIVDATQGSDKILFNCLLTKGISDYDFSTFKVMCINNYDAYLRTMYRNYMQLPPEEKRIPYPKCLVTKKYKIQYDDELTFYLNQINPTLVDLNNRKEK